MIHTLTHVGGIVTRAWDDDDDDDDDDDRSINGGKKCLGR